MPRVSEATRTENRARLLAAAADAFAEHGLHGARIDDISLAAGLAKGTVYNSLDEMEGDYGDATYDEGDTCEPFVNLAPRKYD